MTQAPRQAGALAALVVLLLRQGALSPSTLAVAGTVGLAVYASLALAPSLMRALSGRPDRPDE